jgi:putative transposase
MMTDDTMALLLDQIQASTDGDFLRAIAAHPLQRLMEFEMEFEVDGLIGAGRHERSDERTTYRNGHRARPLETRLGTLDLKIPKLRQGSYFPAFLEPRKTAEKALTAVIQEAWIQGVSTRKVDDLVQALGMTGISKSQVSALCREIDTRVQSFVDRPLDGEWPYLWLDAIYIKVRQNGRIVSIAAIIATGVTQDGRREILGLGLGLSEAAAFWIEFLRGLVRRGLTGVKLVISDAHEGLKAAITQVLSATWQRCRVHFMRSLLANVAKSQQTVVSAAVRQVFVQPDRKAAGDAWRHVADQLRPRFPKVAALLDNAEPDVLAYMDYPEPRLSRAPSQQTAFDQPNRALEQGSQTSDQRCRHFSQ